MKRIEWIDAMKGYAICMMMFSHIEYAPTFLKNYISPIFLALFFISAGYTFHTSDHFKSFFLKKVRTLLWPWFIFGSFNIILTQILTFSEQETLWQQFLNLFLQIRGQNDGLWFFPCMFCVVILFYLLHRFLPNKTFFYGIQILLLLASMYYTLNGGSNLPWHIQMWGSGSFYMSIGYYFQENEKQLAFLHKKSVAFVSFLLFTFSYILYNSIEPNVHINFYDYGSSIFFYFIIMISGVIFSISILQQLPSPSIIQYAGRCSLLYFAFHGKPKRLFSVLITRMFPIVETNWPLGLILSIIELLILLYILVIPCEIVRRFFPFLLGKKQTTHLS